MSNDTSTNDASGAATMSAPPDRPGLRLLGDPRDGAGGQDEPAPGRAFRPALDRTGAGGHGRVMTMEKRSSAGATVAGEVAGPPDPAEALRIAEALLFASATPVGRDELRARTEWQRLTCHDGWCATERFHITVERSA